LGKPSSPVLPGVHPVLVSCRNCMPALQRELENRLSAPIDTLVLSSEPRGCHMAELSPLKQTMLIDALSKISAGLHDERIAMTAPLNDRTALDFYAVDISLGEADRQLRGRVDPQEIMAVLQNLHDDLVDGPTTVAARGAYDQARRGVRDLI